MARSRVKNRSRSIARPWPSVAVTAKSMPRILEIREIFNLQQPKAKSESIADLKMDSTMR
jgi:hypothetical protein